MDLKNKLNDSNTTNDEILIAQVTESSQSPNQASPLKPGEAAQAGEEGAAASSEAQPPAGEEEAALAGEGLPLGEGMRLNPDGSPIPMGQNNDPITGNAASEMPGPMGPNGPLSA